MDKQLKQLTEMMEKVAVISKLESKVISSLSSKPTWTAEEVLLIFRSEVLNYLNVDEEPTEVIDETE